MKKVEDKIKLLEDSNFNKQWFEKHYIENKESLDTIRKNIIKDGIKIGKTGVKDVISYYNIPMRSRQEAEELRQKNIKKTYDDKEVLYGVGITIDKAIELYKYGYSLNEMYDLYGISQVVLSRELKKRSISVRTEKSIQTYIKKLNDLAVKQNSNINELLNNNSCAELSLLTGEEFTKKIIKNIQKSNI